MASATMKKLSPVVSPVTEKKIPTVRKPAVAVVKNKPASKTAAEAKAPVKPVEKLPAKAPAAINKQVAPSKPAGKPVEPKATLAISKVNAEVVEKVKKPKLVRDSFTMPESEYAALGTVKKACLKAGVEVKKSQLLRIGVALLSKTDVPALKKLIAGLAPLKAGRPKKEK